MIRHGIHIGIADVSQLHIMAPMRLDLMDNG